MKRTDPSFRRTAIEPFDCLFDAYTLVSRHYWTFVGAGALVFLACLVPFGAVSGPFLVGMHLLLQDGEAGRRVRVGRVLDGLQRWKPAVVASLIMAGVLLAVFVPLYLLLVAGAVATFGMAESAGADASPLLSSAMLVVSFLMGCAMALVCVPFTFCFQLIAERGLGGLEAVQLSARAARAHLGGLAALWILCALPCMLGLALCGAPVPFVLPFALAALHAAYRRVFGEPATGADPRRRAA